MTKFQLFAALAVQGEARITLIKGNAVICGILLSVEREDGSGSSFNVQIRTDAGHIRQVHIRTVD